MRRTIKSGEGGQLAEPELLNFRVKHKIPPKGRDFVEEF
jgi:hypothetical protein